MRESLRRLAWLSSAASDRLRLRALRAWHPGLHVHPSATPAFARARFNLAPGGRLEISAGAATERRPGWLAFVIHPGGEVHVGEGAWLRTEVAPVTLVAFPGGRIEIGPHVLLNGCHVSAKHSVRIAHRAMVGPGTRVFDSDQHDFDDSHPERGAPVSIGEYAWVSSDCTVLRGVQIGAHAVVGARSLVTRDVDPHQLVYGQPAREHGVVGDRSQAR